MIIEQGIVEIDVKLNQYCVYAHYVGTEIVYIGVGGLEQAFWKVGQGRGAAWKEAVKNGYRVSIVALYDDRDKAIALEKLLIKSLKPKLNIIHTDKHHPRKNIGRTGQPHSEESIKKMAERARLSWERQKELGKNTRKVAQKIKCIESGEVFNGMAEAARKLGISITGISMCVNGKRISAKGKTFTRVSV